MMMDWVRNIGIIVACVFGPFIFFALVSHVTGGGLYLPITEYPLGIGR